MSNIPAEIELKSAAQKAIRVRITNHGQIGGWGAEVFRNGGWVRVPNLVTDGNGSSMYAAFDNRTQAVRAAKKHAKWLA